MILNTINTIYSPHNTLLSQRMTDDIGTSIFQDELGLSLTPVLENRLRAIAYQQSKLILADSGQASSDASCNLDMGSAYFQEKDSKGRIGQPCEVRVMQGNGRGFVWANPTPEALLGYNQSTSDKQEDFYASGDAKERLDATANIVMTGTEVGAVVKGGVFVVKNGSGVAGDVVDSIKDITQSTIKSKSSQPPLPTPSKPVVTAQVKVGDASFSDVNQTARTGVDPEQPTLIADRIASKVEKNTAGKSYPNATMGTAHAEIGAIQQAFNAGKTKGQSMTMSVSGKDVCGYCKGDIAAAAERAGLKSLTINAIDNVTKLPKIYQWTPGMTTIKRTMP